MISLMIAYATELVQEVPKELSVPSGYFQLPVWVLVAAVGAILSLIGVIYHQLDKGLAANANDIKSNVIEDNKCSAAVQILETRLNLIDSAVIKKDEIDRVWEEKFMKEVQQIHIDSERLDKLEEARSMQTKEELSKGGYVTMEKLMESNQKLMESFTRIISDRADIIEKNLALQLENARLSIIANGKKKKGAK